MSFALSQGRAWQGATDATVPYAVIRSDALLGSCQLTVILNNGKKRIVHCDCSPTAIFVEVVFLIAFFLVAFGIMLTKLQNGYGISKFLEPVSVFVRSVSVNVHLYSDFFNRFFFSQL